MTPNRQIFLAYGYAYRATICATRDMALYCALVRKSDSDDYHTMRSHERQKAFNKANLAAMLVPLPCERP